jgi:transcriptional regulator with XRE-family HTH domain
MRYKTAALLSIRVAAMKIEKQLTDMIILKEIGARLARRRLDLQLTQAEVATEAGLAKRTVERIEAGDSIQMASVIRVLRVLDLMDGLDGLVPDAGFGLRPMDMLRLKRKERKRASSPRKQNDGEWHWGDK